MEVATRIERRLGEPAKTLYYVNIYVVHIFCPPGFQLFFEIARDIFIYILESISRGASKTLVE